MKALSVRPQWAHLILMEEKTVECRSWRTDYRGDLLICASSEAFPGTISGHALCVVTLEDIVPLTEDHLKAAGLEAMPDLGDKPLWAWKLTDMRLIEPFPHKGQQGLYEVPDEVVTILPLDGDDEAWSEWWEAHYAPFFENGFYIPKSFLVSATNDTSACGDPSMCAACLGGLD